jgi:ribosomal-protein-alanine N-acetyltransferase
MARTEPIITERMTLLSYSPEFLTCSYVGWLNDPEIMKYSEGRFKKHTPESCREYMDSFENSPNYLWAIVAKDPSIGHIGNINCYVNPNHMLADIGIMVGEKSQNGKGYGKEAFAGIVDFLFVKAGIRKVTAGTMSLNIPMLKIMHSLCMRNDGVRKRHYICGGGEVDIVHMCLFKEDWPLKTEKY